jgi:hypothetical protein
MFGHHSDQWSQSLLFSDDIATSDATAPGSRQQLAAQHSNGGGFAGAVVAQEPEDLTHVN